MTEIQPHMDFGEIRAAAHDLAEKRREARRDYERRSEEAAEAERDFRKELAIQFTCCRSDDKGVGESEILANGHEQVAGYRHKRDICQSLAKAALLRIEELEADRAMLRQLGDWSQRMEGVVA